MATDATGTPTALGIPKYNTATDPPSGKGFNAAMDALDALLQERLVAPSGIVAGEVPVWDGSAWARSSTRRINNAGNLLPKITRSDIGSPPASPSEGDIWFATGVAGLALVWQFVYMPAYSGTNDWMFVGGPALVAEGGSTNTTSTTYVDLATPVSPAITVPRTGEYQLRLGANMYQASTGSVYLAPKFGTAAASDAWGVIYENPGTVVHISLGAERSPTLTAGDALTLQARVGGGTGYISAARVALVPVRVS